MRASSGATSRPASVVEQRQQLVADAVATEAPGRRSTDRVEVEPAAPRTAPRSRRAEGASSGRRGSARAHRRQPVEPGAAQQVQQHRLGLVVERCDRSARSGRQRRRSGRPGPAPRGWARPDVDDDRRGSRARKRSAASAHDVGLVGRSGRAARGRRARRSRRSPAATARTSRAVESGPPDTAHVDRRPRRRERAAGEQLVGRAPRRSRPGPRSGRRPRSAQPDRSAPSQPPGSRISLRVGRFAGSAHARSIVRGPRSLLDHLDEPLPCSYCFSLASSPISFCSSLHRRVAPVARAGAGRGRSGPRSGSRSAPARSIVTSPWPSSRLIRPLDLLERIALLGRRRAAPTMPPSSSGFRPGAELGRPLGVSPRNSSSGRGRRRRA